MVGGGIGRCAQHTTAGGVCAAACPGMAGEMLARPPPCSAALVRAARKRGVSVLDVPALAFDEAHDDDGLVMPLPPLLNVKRVSRGRSVRVKRVLKWSCSKVFMGKLFCYTFLQRCCV